MLKRVLGLAAILATLCAAPAAAQQSSQLGWLAQLSGSCWQGGDADGAAVDQRCFQTQFNRFLRGAITRGALRNETVLGWSNERNRLELYAWSNQGEPSVFTPELRNGLLIFSGESENGSATRAIWRQSENGFEIVDQVQQSGVWTDGRVTSYARAGAAPAAYSASSNAAAGAGFGWIGALGGRCLAQTEPTRNAANRVCFGWQHPTILRQTWYWGGGAPTGETVIFGGAGGGMRFYYWDAQGNFGVGESLWSNNRLYSITDGDTNTRQIWRRRGSGFELITQTRDLAEIDRPWVYVRHYRFAGR